ncbi:MAG: ABC transporter ATP-binding protein, partial [Lachnospiraceae bacterium]|nr:ABC transporter ATP-binding protein [Lachnospiraceae bacterium]
MLKILRFLSKSAFSVVLIILLLCIQAKTDLDLPDYTSKMINIGIQQGGIENVSPDAISKIDMENLLIFTKDDKQIMDAYELISREILSNKDYEKYEKEYPLLEKEDLYILKNLKQKELDNLNTVMSEPLMELYVVTNREANQELIASMM